HFSRACPPFQARVVNPMTLVFTPLSSKIFKITKSQGTRSEITFLRLPELSIKITTAGSRFAVQAETLAENDPISSSKYSSIDLALRFIFFHSLDASGEILKDSALLTSSYSVAYAE